MNMVSNKTATAFGTGISQHPNSQEAGKQAAQSALGKISGHRASFGLVFCSSKYDYEEVLKGIKSVAGEAQILGCSSASEFTEEQVTKDSVVCAFIASSTHRFFTTHGEKLTKDPLQAMKTAAMSMPPNDDAYPYRSAIILMDALPEKESRCARLPQPYSAPTCVFRAVRQLTI